MLAFLHTSPVHVATFDRLLAEVAPMLTATHIIDEQLLHDAREKGITPELHERIIQTLARAAEDGAAVILCTCSTIGACAEASATVERPVLRVDRAMAERAVATGERIVLLAALASTLVPTRELLLEAAAQVGKTVTVTEVLCDAAWPLFERGDHAGYLAAVAACIRDAATLGDVTVLAQASMAGAAALCSDLAVPVLSSPRLGLEAAVAAYYSQNT